jgi:SAM-dependent methyltransferase
MTSSTAVSDFDALKARLKSTWMAGDYDLFSRYMEPGAREFHERIGVPSGASLLDVACGSGQLALIAARAGAKVTGVDIASNLIQKARERAAAEGLDARFEEGDAEALPFPDASFDFVASVVGAMFAPRPERAAREMARVCAPGGAIAMANWTRGGFIGRMFQTITKFIAPSGMPSPLLWGDEETVRERFGDTVSSIRFTRQFYLFDYPFPPAGVVGLFRNTYGPTNVAFATLNETDGERLRQELEALWSEANESRAGGTRVRAEYLEVIARRK